MSTREELEKREEELKTVYFEKCEISNKAGNEANDAQEAWLGAQQELLTYLQAQKKGD